MKIEDFLLLNQDGQSLAILNYADRVIHFTQGKNKVEIFKLNDFFIRRTAQADSAELLTAFKDYNQFKLFKAHAWSLLSGN